MSGVIMMPAALGGLCVLAGSFYLYYLLEFYKLKFYKEDAEQL